MFSRISRVFTISRVYLTELGGWVGPSLTYDPEFIGFKLHFHPSKKYKWLLKLTNVIFNGYFFKFY